MNTIQNTLINKTSIAWTSLLIFTLSSIPTSAQTISEIRDILKKTTVQINTDANPGGSGVIIKKEGNIYTVLTANHVVCVNLGRQAVRCRTDHTYTIRTHDGIEYPIKERQILQTKVQDPDLAIVTFESEQEYETAPLGNSSEVDIQSDIYVAGFPTIFGRVGKNRSFTITNGKVVTFIDNPPKGYGLIYDATTRIGNSGGPVFDIKGKLIGIHGLADADEIETNNTNQSETTNNLRANVSTIRKLINPKTESGGSFQVKTGFNAGIPINILYGVLPQNYFNARSITPPSDSINNRQKKVVRKYVTTDKFSKYQPRLAAAQVHPSNYGERFSRDTKGMAVSNQPIIVLHETTYSASSAINYFQNHNVDEDIQASYHAIIARDGTVIYLVPPDKRAFGAGNSVFKNTDGTIETVQTNPKLAPSVDNFAYHVSLETPPDGWGKRNIREHSGYTQEQYNSLAWLIAQSQVPDERITTHRSVDVANGKVDPLSFDFDRFFKKLHSFRKLHSIAQSHS